MMMMRIKCRDYNIGECGPLLLNHSHSPSFLFVCVEKSRTALGKRFSRKQCRGLEEKEE